MLAIYCFLAIAYKQISIINTSQTICIGESLVYYSYIILYYAILYKFIIHFVYYNMHQFNINKSIV